MKPYHSGDKHHPHHKAQVMSDHHKDHQIHQHLRNAGVKIAPGKEGTAAHESQESAAERKAEMEGTSMDTE